MSGKSIFSKSALAVLVVAMATTAIPLEVMAQERQQRGERSGARGGDGGNGGGGRMWGRSGDAGNRQATQARPQRVQQQPQTAAAPVQRAAPSTQRVERPAAGSWRGTGNVENGARWSREDRGQADRATPQRTTPAPSQIRTPDRPATAQTTPQRGWDGTRWNGTSPGRNNGSNNGNWRDNDRRDDNRNANGSWNGRNQGYADRDRNRDYRDRDRNDGRGNSWNSNNGRRDGWNNNNRGDNRRWSNDWRRDNRYNWSQYRTLNRGFYRLPTYYAPYRGYGYNRLSIGIFLNSGFYGNNYWINDPWSYRLPPAYGSYRWVRYWNDVILVDTYSGEVVDVIHNFFW